MLVCSWEWLPPVNRSDSSLTADQKWKLFSPRYSSTETLGVKCLWLGCGDCCCVKAVKHHGPMVLADGKMLIYSKGLQWCNAAVSINTQEEGDFTVTKHLDPSSFQSSSKLHLHLYLYQLLKKIRSHQKRNYNCEHKVWDATCKTQNGWFLNQLSSTSVNTAATDKGAPTANYHLKKRHNDENISANSS